MKFLYNWFKKLLNTEKSDEKVSKDQMTRSFENVVVEKIIQILVKNYHKKLGIK